MAYQRGSLLKLHRKAGDIWVLRYRENQGRQAGPKRPARLASFAISRKRKMPGARSIAWASCCASTPSIWTAAFASAPLRSIT